MSHRCGCSLTKDKTEAGSLGSVKVCHVPGNIFRAGIDFALVLFAFVNGRKWQGHLERCWCLRSFSPPGKSSQAHSLQDTQTEPQLMSSFTAQSYPKYCVAPLKNSCWVETSHWLSHSPLPIARISSAAACPHSAVTDLPPARYASAKPHLFSFQACNPISCSSENSLKHEAAAGRSFSHYPQRTDRKCQAPGFSKTASFAWKKMLNSVAR